MVLVGERRPEQRHDPVAHHLVDCALVAVHRFHHVLERRVEQLPRLFGIAVGEQLHRALEVGEEHRDLFALAFEGGPQRQNPLGKVFGGVSLGRGGLGYASRFCRGIQGLSALLAELVAGGIVGTTLGAENGERRTTFRAELGVSGCFLVAPGTGHGVSTAGL
jgi:hypothetical protein